MKADRYYRKRHPMVLAATGCICGIATAEGVDLCWMLLLFFLAAGLLIWHDWRNPAVFVGMLVVGVLVLWTAQQEPAVLQQSLDQRVTLQGMVSAHSPGQSYLWLKSNVHTVTGGREILYVELPVSDDADRWYAPGTVLQVQGVPMRPQGQRNPGGFDEARWLREQGAHFKLQADRVDIVAQPEGLYVWSARTQQYVRETLALQLPAKQYGIVLGMLLGDTGQMDAGLYRQAQRMGFAHVFAVSGLHVGFVGALLLFFLRWTGMNRSPLALPVLTAVLGFYVMLTGFPPSAVRAAGMLLLAVLAQRLVRQIVPVDYLAMLAVLLLVDCPYLLWAAGFQLSFGVTLALLLFVRPLQRQLQWIPFAKLRDSVAVVLAAWIGSLPLGAWHFYSVSLLSPFFNLMLVPVVSVLVPLVLIALAAYALLPFAGALLFVPVRMLLSLWLGMIHLCDAFSVAGHWNTGQPGFWCVLLFLVFTGLLYVCLSRDGAAKRRCGCVAAVVLLGSIWLGMPAPPAQDELLVLDAGQGSCAVLRTAAGEVLVFDGGSRSRELTSTLAWYGVNRVDALILSHSDTDHITGLPVLLESIPVTIICAEEHQMKRDTMIELTKLAQERGTSLHAVDASARMKLKEGDVQLRVYDDGSGGANSTELAALVQLQGDTIAFPGDLGLAGAEAFIRDCPEISVWMVPHHGSRYSGSTQLYRMLQQKNVRQAVISVGVDNRYGHPHREILEELQRAGIPVQRTDIEGAVEVPLSS